MVTLRKVTLVAVLAASLAVLVLAAYLFWNLGQGSLDTQAGHFELLIVILLASCGLYAIVFALSSYSSAMSFAQQADRSIAAIRDQLGTRRLDGAGLIRRAALQRCGSAGPAPGDAEARHGFRYDRFLQRGRGPTAAAVGRNFDFGDLAIARPG